MTSSIFGSVVLRSEDPRFLSGKGRYVANVQIEGALHAVFVRSMLAHAGLVAVDVTAALGSPGVAAVFTAADLDLDPQPPSGNVSKVFTRPVLAREVVRFVGEPIAVVIADTLAEAIDATELVVVDYDPLRVVTDLEAAVEAGAPVLFPEAGSNVAHEFDSHWNEDVLRGAEVVVAGRFVNQRLAPVPMETDSFVAVPDGDGLTVWASTQVPFDVRNDVADALGLARERVRAIAPDVGGGFGAKLWTYPEYLAVSAAAVKLGRPIRWSQSRSECMLAMTHGRAQVQRVELGALRDGTIVGLKVDILADQGAYPIAAFLAPTTQEMLSGVYRTPRIACRGRSVVTNTTPIGPYRGAGRPEATALVERVVDILADELGFDPVEIRRRNLIPPDAFPFDTASGAHYDTGEYERALDEALGLAGYEELRAEQEERRRSGNPRLLGIGVATYVEITAYSGREFGSVEVHADGNVTVRTGTSPHGQGHETAFAQIAAGVLGVPFERVRVVHSDTALVPRGEGTWGSRSLQIGGSSVFDASEKVLAKARRLAAHVLEVAEDDVVRFEDGRVGVAGAPDAALDWSRLAELAGDSARLPHGMEPGLSAEGDFRQKQATFPFGAHVAVVDVDVDTGEVRLVRFVAVDDCGRILNPLLVEGQVHGGIGQGVAQALYEEVVFDEVGSNLTGNLATYAMPSAAELPPFESAHTETPTPRNPLGAKGIGESATIGSTPAVQNAVVDALSHLGVRHLDLPLSPERVWRALHGG